MFATKAEADVAAKQVWDQQQQKAQDPGDLLLMLFSHAA